MSSPTLDRPAAETAVGPPASGATRVTLMLLRIGVAFLWIQNVAWKNPPDFGRSGDPSGLFYYTSAAVEYPVLSPYAWLVDHLVLPNFLFFAWAVLIVESAIGAFLLVGLATRFWAGIGFLQAAVITLSALNAPNEWQWSYVLMLLANLAILGVAAGRYAGVDGLLRPRWLESDTRWSRLLARVS